jgi:hypothetical protein
MSRVWKHFLKNLAWPVGIAAYIVAVSFGAAYAETLFKSGGFTVAMIFVIMPVLAYLIRDMWRDAKEKVKEEDYREQRIVEKMRNTNL